MQHVREFISVVLNERSFDLSVEKTARELMRDIIESLEGYPDRQVRRAVVNVDGRHKCPCYFVTINDLGILSNNIVSKLAIGIIPTEYYPSDTEAVYLTKNEHMPSGGVFLLDPDASLSAQQILFMIKQNRYAFYHELIHFIEFSLKSSDERIESLGKSIENVYSKKDKKEKMKAYLTQPHELNAYMHQSFRQLIDFFENKTPLPDQVSAQHFVKNIQDLWNKLYKLLPSFKTSIPESELMKKLSFRAWELWQDYVESLPQDSSIDEMSE